MATLYKDGKVLEWTATKKTEVGDIVPLKNVCGVAMGSGAIGDVIVLDMTRAYTDSAKIDDVIEVGTRLFWDATAKEITVVDTDNTPLGLAMYAKASGVSEVTFKLNA